MAGELELSSHGRVHLQHRAGPGEHVFDGCPAPERPRVVLGLTIDRDLDLPGMMNIQISWKPL
jgi:hypothetical protein